MIDRWNRFWFETRIVDTLGLIRIGVGIALLMKLTGATSPFIDGELNIQVPQYTFSNDSQFFLDGFRLPLPGFEWIPALSYNTFWILDLVVLLLAVAFTLGWLLHISGPALALCYGYIFVQSQFFYHHHVFALFLVLMILAWSKGVRRYSLDSIIEPVDNSFNIMPLRLIQVLVSSIYLFGAIVKMNWGWVSGEVIEVLVESGRVRGAAGEFVLGFLPYWLVGSGTILLEMFLAFALWIPGLRKPAFLFGIGLHVGIDSAIEVEVFGFLMLVLYIAFIDPESNRYRFVFDSRSAAQRRIVQRLKLLDWFQRFRFQPVSVQTVDAGSEFALSQLNNWRDWLEILEKFPLTFIPAFLTRTVCQVFRKRGQVP